MNFELIYLLDIYRYRPSQIRSLDGEVVEAAAGWLIFRLKGPEGVNLRSPEKAKGGVIADSPFCTNLGPNLELISVVQTPVCPLSTATDSAIMFHPKVSLYGSGQV
jgi:hypothetical protein